MTSLLIDPESELVFSLSKKEATPRCMMTLKHPGGTDEFVAFKVGRHTILPVVAFLHRAFARRKSVTFLTLLFGDDDTVVPRSRDSNNGVTAAATLPWQWSQVKQDDVLTSYIHCSV